MPRLGFFRTLACAAICAATSTLAYADLSRRIFDFTPVSESNPIVATLGEVQIPLSELRGYRTAERPKFLADPANLAQKRTLLDDLLNEYLYIDEAYRTGVPDSPAFARRMDATRTMVLTDFISMRAAAGAAKPADAATQDDGSAGAALAEKLFEAASITVSNEAYAVLKRSAADIDAATAAVVPETGGALPEATTERLHLILSATPQATLVRYEDRAISVHQILAIYAGLPVAKRPPVQTQDGLIAMIKPLIAPELMAIEAIKRGIADEPAFQEKIIQNRNALLRFHMHGAIESRANDLLRSPELETHLRTWHRENADRYRAAPDADGRRRVLPYAEVRAQVLGDFSVELRERLLAEKARELRTQRKVTVDEAVLEKL